jgi:hypothetical protein
MTKDTEIEERYRELMNQIARGLDGVFNGDKKGADRHTGFVLLVFPFGEDPTNRVNYISNGSDRKEVVIMLKEMIRRFEGQPEAVGHA